MTECCELVGLLADYADTVAQLVTSLRHERVAGVVDEVGEEVVLHICRQNVALLRWSAEFVRVARTPKYVRGLREVLHAPRHHYVGLTQHDHLGAGYDRLSSTAAQAVESEHRNLMRYAGVESGVPSPVDGLSGGLQRVTHHHMIDGGRVGTCPF